LEHEGPVHDTRTLAPSTMAAAVAWPFPVTLTDVWTVPPPPALPPLLLPPPPPLLLLLLELELDTLTAAPPPPF
jgi:hypothetical protein